MNTMCYINWDAISSIASVIMMLVALITFWVTYQQRKEDTRARLTFEIISWKNLFLLKISNIGKECAYNIRMQIDGEFIENHYSEEVKNAFSNICRKTFVMVAGRELHYYLTPVQHSLGSTFMIGKEEFHSQDVNSWLENNKNSKLHISGTYCNKYKFDETLSIGDYIAGMPLVVEDPGTIALKEISKGLSCKNDFHRPIQERIDDIAKSLEKLVRSVNSISELGIQRVNEKN